MRSMQSSMDSSPVSILHTCGMPKSINSHTHDPFAGSVRMFGPVTSSRFGFFHVCASFSGPVYSAPAALAAMWCSAAFDRGTKSFRVVPALGSITYSAGFFNAPRGASTVSRITGYSSKSLPSASEGSLSTRCRRFGCSPPSTTASWRGGAGSSPAGLSVSLGTASTVAGAAGLMRDATGGGREAFRTSLAVSGRSAPPCGGGGCCC
mmetsp:Transcript_36567/g.112683  ORF Transcript_36567/g.112683 Transcript_36567/m.112683 type:complete len:207 (-) Transcript_36567:256-876(-)